MARYGSFKYGGAKYGLTTAANKLTWGLDIDWDNDGVYDGVNEAENMTKLSVRRGRSSLIREDGAGLEPMKTGEFTANLNSLDGRYDPFNPGSPLYPNVVPGKRFRLRVRNEATGVIYSVLTGRVKDLQPANEFYDRVSISGADDMDLLTNVTVRTELKENTGLDDLIHFILDGAEWPSGSLYRTIDTSTDFLPYWWAAGGTAREEIESLIDVAFGTFYIAADGRAVFVSRNSTRTAPDFNIDGLDIQRGVARPQPWEVVRNAVEIIINSRQAQAPATLWELKSSPGIRHGDSMILYAPYTYNSQSVPAKNVQQPTPATEFTVNTNPDGSGTDLTASCTAILTPYADIALIVVDNNSALDGHVTKLSFQGEPVASLPAMFVSGEDAASIAIFGRRRMAIDTIWQQSVHTAVDIRDLLLSIFAEAKSFPRFRIKDNPVKQFAPDLLDHLNLDFPAEHISDTYQIAEIVHEWTEPSGNTVETKLRCEPIRALGNYWIFTTQIGITSIFGY